MEAKTFIAVIASKKLFGFQVHTISGRACLQQSLNTFISIDSMGYASMAMRKTIRNLIMGEEKG